MEDMERAAVDLFTAEEREAMFECAREQMLTERIVERMAALDAMTKDPAEVEDAA